MIEERSRQLLSALEARAADALTELHACRERLQQVQERVAELEAERLELMEENRELDEQNRELEEDNARLRERLRKGEPAPAFPGPARRAQGLAALIGQRPREDQAAGLRAAPARPGDARIGVESSAMAEPPVESRPAPAWRPAASGSPQAIPEPKAESDADRERQGALAIEQAPSADALLKQWYQRYPRTFFKGHTRPLKVGIHHDLAAREPWPEKLVRRALAGYVNLPRYLKAVREGAERLDLDGEPAGSVDAQAAEHAKRKLERLQSERRERDRAAGATPRRDGKAPRGRDDAKGHSRKAKPKSAPKAKERGAPASANPATPADPEARMEAKLSALLAKHNGQAKGP